MQLTVTDGTEKLFFVHVDSEQSSDDIKAVLEVETGIPMVEQELFFNGQVVGSQSVASAGINDGDLLFIRRKQRQVDPRNPNSVYEAVRADPSLMATLRHNNPELAEAASNPNPEAFVRLWREAEAEKERRQEEEMVKRSRIALDPLDPAAQAEIEKEIRTTLVNENMETAMEYNPEVFGQVHMLYIHCELNGHPLKAFVDSGAQMTIMSKSCARRCNLLHLVDERFKGIARGVGTSKIVGRVHSAPMKIAGVYLPVSLTILEDEGMEFLFGLDNLKRHQCCIDLKDNVLRLNDEKNTTVPFLAEHEIPRTASLGDEYDLSPQPMDTTASSSATFSSNAAAAAAPSQPSHRAPQPQPSQQPPHAPPSSSLPPGVTEEKISRIQALGFTRVQAMQALEAAKGNEDLAAGMLF